MKVKLTIGLFMLLSCLIKAQDNYMALSFGGGIPMGDFAKSTDIYSHGYANTGFMADYSGAYYPIDYIGIAGSARFTSNLLKQDEVRRDLFALLPDGTPDDPNARLDIGKWDVISFTFGPQFTYPTSFVDIDIYALVGLNIVNSPKMELQVQDSGGDLVETSLTSQSARFGWDAGINLRFKLSESSGIRVFVGYQHSSVKGELRGSGIEGTPENYIPKIDLINSGIGLVYRL